MSKERIKKIKDRMSWLTTELVHENYYPGSVVKGFRTELTKLITELQELESTLDDTSK